MLTFIIEFVKQAELNINLMPSEYIIISSFNGFNTANSVTVTAKIRSFKHFSYFFYFFDEMFNFKLN